MNLVITGKDEKRRLYIQKSFRKNGKSSSKNVEVLGLLSDLMKQKNMSEEEVIDWARKRAAALTKQEKELSKDVMVRFSQNQLI